MKNFEYLRPTTIPEAVAAAAAPNAAYLAGGTNLLDLMKGGVARPDRVVDISRLPGLDRIERLPDGGVRIGALVRNADLAHDADFRKIVSRDCRSAAVGRFGAASQCRDRRRQSDAANALRIFLRPASACNKREPGSGCDARGGENRLHAVLGWSEHCIATHPSDFCVPLVALDAVVEIEGRGGRREVALEALHLPARRHARAGKRARAWRSDRRAAAASEASGFAATRAILKVRERTSFAFAVVSAAAALADRTGPDLRSAAGAGRRRAETMAGARGREDVARLRAGCRGVSPRGGGGARRRETLRRQRLQDRTGAADRGARPDPGGGRHARTPRGPSCFSLPRLQERFMTLELTQNPAHARHGSNNMAPASASR